ncbi:hypothetical protein DFH09DRAFT_1498228 [Mycena vulgaris]|nr:hypothetical protein DFH09DRAFT_1498228 [Mycena vulgaris]
MTRKGPLPLLTANQLKLHLSHVIGPTPERDKYDSPVVVLEMSEFEAEHWLAVRQAADKWILKRSRDEEMNKQRSPSGSNGYIIAAAPDDSSKRGPKRRFDWTEQWKCGHSGKYRDERKPDLSPRKRRPNRHHPSVKVGCDAYIFLRKICGQDLVKIEYGWEHDGHEPGTIRDMAGSMLPIRVKEWIDMRANEGLDWKAIKPLLRLDAAIRTKVLSLDVAFPTSDATCSYALEDAGGLTPPDATIPSKLLFYVMARRSESRPPIFEPISAVTLYVRAKECNARSLFPIPIPIPWYQAVVEQRGRLDNFDGNKPLTGSRGSIPPEGVTTRIKRETLLTFRKQIVSKQQRACVGTMMIEYRNRIGWVSHILLKQIPLTRTAAWK